ncbi:hypothetical protein BCF55_1408 [Hydrogenivirga caldilitoris]|uniref:Uncharacterized protein n=1 Tax=Hydrogenivirga caldilitoris TaxID=246264 RepID=A0A497XS56_9AQUI|nr:hypothetical protein [Hydrogenivirga caldilitoris]RLJ71114.1 hypothetical protein BCF55_1408 [Hydrogenivirga caldilitoris]
MWGVLWLLFVCTVFSCAPKGGSESNFDIGVRGKVELKYGK